MVAKGWIDGILYFRTGDEIEDDEVNVDAKKLKQDGLTPFGLAQSFCPIRKILHQEYLRCRIISLSSCTRRREGQ